MTAYDEPAALLGPNEVLVAEDVVTQDERRHLVAWLRKQHRNLVRNPLDTGACSTPFRAADGELTQPAALQALRGGMAQPIIWLPEIAAPVDPLPQEVWRIRARVAERLGLHAFDDDPYKGSFMSVIEPGTGVHQHRDERLLVDGEARPILRCNLFLQRAEAGGDPVFDGRLRLDVAEGGMWAFYPTELVHAATTVQGTQPRVLLSLGFLGRMAQWWLRRFAVRPAFRSAFGLDQDGDQHAVHLMDRASTALRAAGVNDDRLAVLRLALERTSEDFSIQEVSGRLTLPPARVGSIVADLQRSEVLESRSAARQDRGKVWVL